MTSKLFHIPLLSGVSATLFPLFLQPGRGAEFEYQLVDDSFQQLWSKPIYWTLVSGDDDEVAGYPDATDTFTLDRSTATTNSTRLAIEGGPPFEVGGITGRGGLNRDIVLKFGEFTLGYLEVLESSNTLLIQSERDKDFTITGVISGAGNLELHRLGGFSDGVDPDEHTTLTGDEPNTITGTIRLFNSNGAGQPAYWVADKVGAFGQTPELTIEGRAALSGASSLQITTNSSGGEGAIDDDATTVFLGAEGLFNLDAGVNEVIGEGKLFIDLEGTGTYAEVPVGTYDNSEPWIIGDGTITVGGSNLGLVITEIDLESDETNPILTLSWNSNPGRTYSVFYSTDLTDWSRSLGTDIAADEGESTTWTYDLAGTPDLVGEPTVFYRIEEE